MSAKKEKNVKEKKKISLTSMIFIALIAGAITGMVLHYLVPDSSVKNDVIVEGVLYVLGQGFIRLMKMLVVPLVFCSLVCGSMAIGDTKKLGNVGGKTLAFYLVTTAVAVAVALGIGTLLRPGIGLDMSKIQVNASDIETMESTSLVQTILNIIPDNPIKSLASGEMLQIIVFALIIGVILAKLGERAETVSNFISQFNDIMMEMTMMVMSLAPIGVFSLIARTFATIGFSAFVPLAKYMIAVLIALAIQCFGVYQILLKLFTGLNPVKFIRKFFPVMAFAFSTATSNATIPLSIDTLYKKMGVSKKISSFTIPLGATINMDGAAITITIMTLAAANTLGIQVSLPAAIVLSAMSALGACGASGVAGGSLLLIPMACSLFGISNDVAMQMVGVGFIIGVVQDSVETALNSAGDVEFAATAEYHQWRKQGKPLPEFLTGKKN